MPDAKIIDLEEAKASRMAAADLARAEAIMISINSDKTLVTTEWLDRPGLRSLVEKLKAILESEAP